MKKVTERQKLRQKTQEEMIMRTRKRRKHRSKRVLNKPHRYAHFDHNRFELMAPAHLSLVDNKEETLAFFDEAIKATRECKVRQTIYFNLEKVEFITPDAIMYIIALVNNVKRVRTFRITCGGNMPSNADARAFIEKSGFYSYVNSLSVPHTFDTSNRLQISSGDNVNGPLTGSICDFVHSHSDSNDARKTKRLYPMITELMTNTCQHAYKDAGSFMDDKWYVYVEDTDAWIYFVFLDTGVGIPATIRLNFAEKVERLLIGNNDAKYISSALKGKFRTETKQGHRGKGLPGVYSDAQSGEIYDLTIISGKGECSIVNNSEIRENNLPIPFRGTLFCWKFRKFREGA